MLRTTDQLLDRIAADLVWRRRELSDMRALVQESSNQLRHRVLVRAAVAILYAHWEGFVKSASSRYLEFVASQRLSYRQLTPNFVGLTLRAKYFELGVSEKISSGNSLADFFCSSMDKQSRIPYRDGVDTKSNLSSKVLLDILAALGLDHSNFESRLRFIDSSLVGRRNHIAHGEDLTLTVEEYLELHDDVLALIEVFRNEVENSSVMRCFQREPA